MVDNVVSGRNPNPLWKQRRNNSFNVFFPTLPSLESKPRTARLYQKWYAHDVMVLTFSEPRNVWFEQLQTGVPIQLHWAQDSLENTWYGYVSHVSKEVKAQKVREMQVHCIGSTFPLKERATEVFTDCTIPEVVEKIVTQHGFHFIGDSHPRRFSQLVMAGHSYWEWIQEQAKRIGYAVMVDGSNFYFREMDALVDQMSTSVPMFSAGQSSVGWSQSYDRTLDKFEVLKGEYDEGAENVRNDKITGGVNPLTAQPFTAQTSPKELLNGLRSTTNDVFFREYRSEQVAHEAASVQTASEGAAKLAQYTLPAKAAGQGDPRVKPFTPVYILDTGVETDGHWIVKSVMHLLHKDGSYTVTMDLVTDGTGASIGTPLRTAYPDKYGEVNLQEALARNTNGANVRGKKHTRLSSVAPGYQHTDQGYNRTPALWSVDKVS